MLPNNLKKKLILFKTNSLLTSFNLLAKLNASMVNLKIYNIKQINLYLQSLIEIILPYNDKPQFTIAKTSKSKW